MDGVLTDAAVRLAEELAELTGASVRDAVTRALARQVAQERERREADLLAAKPVAIGRECAALLTPPFDSADHADLLYGADGLPA
jgi:hypothetical protein